MLAQCRRVFSALVLQNMWFLIDYISRTFPVPRFSQPASSSSSAHALNAQVRVRERMGASVSLKSSLDIECASVARKTDENTKWLPPSSQVCWYARKTLCIFHAVPNQTRSGQKLGVKSTAVNMMIWWQAHKWHVKRLRLGSCAA